MPSGIANIKPREGRKDTLGFSKEVMIYMLGYDSRTKKVPAYKTISFFTLSMYDTCFGGPRYTCTIQVLASHAIYV